MSSSFTDKSSSHQKVIQIRTWTNHRIRLLWVTLIIAFLLSLWAQTPRLLDPYQVEEDFRNLYWVNLFTEPQAFPKDPYLENNVVQLGLGNWTLPAVDVVPSYPAASATGPRSMNVILEMSQ